MSEIVKETAEYVEMSDSITLSIVKDGTAGTSINMKPGVPSTEDLPSSGASMGDSYIIGGHLWTYTGTTASDDTHVKGFTDCGKVSGEAGKNNYVHVAWSNKAKPTLADDIALDNTDGAAYAYMGTWVSETKDDTKAEALSMATWVYVKGEKGDTGIVYDVYLSVSSLKGDSTGKLNSKDSVAVSAKVVKVSVGTATEVTSTNEAYFTISRTTDSGGVVNYPSGNFTSYTLQAFGTGVKTWNFALYVGGVFLKTVTVPVIRDGTLATVYTIEPWGSVSASGTLKDANTIRVTVKGDVKAYKTTGDRKEEYSSQPQSWRLSIGGTNYDGTATFDNNASNNIISFSLTQDYSISGTVPGSANIALYSDSSHSKQLASLIVPVSLNPGAIQDINAKLGTIQNTTTDMQNTVNGMHGTIETIRQGQGAINLKVQAIGRRRGNIIPGGNVAGMYMKRYEAWRSMVFTMVQGKTYTVTARIWKEPGPNGHFMRLFVFGADNSWTYQYNSGYPLTNTSARVVRFKFEAGVTKEMVVGLYEQGGSTGSLLSGVHIDWCRVDEGDWTGDEVLDKWAPAASEVDALNLLPDPAFENGIAYSDALGERDSYNGIMGATVSGMVKDGSADEDGCYGVTLERSGASSADHYEGLRFVVPFRGAGTYFFSASCKDMSKTVSGKPALSDGFYLQCNPLDSNKDKIREAAGTWIGRDDARCGQERISGSYSFADTVANGSGKEVRIAYLELRVLLLKNGCVRVSRMCLSKSDHYIYWNAAEASAERKKELGQLATGVDIYNKKIIATADNFMVRNNSGDQTFSIDRDGNIAGSGNASFRGKVYASGGEFTGTVTAAKIYGAYINGGSITGTTVTGSSITSTSADGKSVTKITGGQLTTGTTNKLIIDTPGNEPGGVLRITQGSDDVVKLGVTDATGKAYADIKGAWENETIARNICAGPYLMLGQWAGRWHGEDRNMFAFLSKNFMYVKHVDAEFLNAGGMRMTPVTLTDIDFSHYRRLRDIDEAYMQFHGYSQYNHPSELYFWNSSEITFDLGDPAEHDDLGLVKNAGRILFIWQMGARIIFKGTPNPTSGNTAACMYLGRKIRGETLINSDCLGQLNILMSDGKHWVMHYMND